MIVYLLRHGETEYNITKQYTGTLDIPVSDAGLKRLIEADFSPSTVYTSPLCRARQTAQVLFPKAELINIEAFKEMCFGELEGKFYDLSADKSGAGFASAAKGGETREGFCERTNFAFEKLIESEIEKNTQIIVIVAHGGTQMSVLSAYCEEKRAYEQWCGKNGGGFILKIESEKWRREKSLYLLKEIVYSK